MQVAMTEAFSLGLSVEEADAVFGRPLGIPKTGIFGLYDLIGIDLMADVLKALFQNYQPAILFIRWVKSCQLLINLLQMVILAEKEKVVFSE